MREPQNRTKRLSAQVCTLLFVLGTIVLAQSDAAGIAKAETLLKNLQDGKYSEVVKDFDARMLQAIPEERLRAV